MHLGWRVLVCLLSGLFFLTLVLYLARLYLEKHTPIGKNVTKESKSLEERRAERIPFLLSDLPFESTYQAESFGTMQFDESQRNAWLAALQAPYEWVFVHTKDVEFDVTKLYDLKPQDGVSVWPKPGETMDFELFPEVYGAERFITSFALFHRPTCKALLEMLASDDTLSFEEAVLLSRTPFTLRGDDTSVLGVEHDGTFIGRYVCFDHESIRHSVSSTSSVELPDAKWVRMTGGKIEPMDLYAMSGGVREVLHPFKKALVP